MSGTPRTDAYLRKMNGTEDEAGLIATDFARQLERELADYTRRSECGDSRLDWIERGERIMDLEVTITEMQIELDRYRNVVGKVEDICGRMWP